MNLTVCAVKVNLSLISLSGNSPKALESRSKNTLFASSAVLRCRLLKKLLAFRAKVVVESLLFRKERIQDTAKKR